MIVFLAALAACSALRRTAPALRPRPTARHAAARTQPRVQLSLEEESALAALAQREHALQRARADLAQELGRTPTGDEWARAAINASAAELGALRRESRAAKDALIRANAGLVVAIARGYQQGWRSVPLDDLVQEGTLGLIRAAEKFDGSRGARFSTYATTWIRSAISTWIKVGESPIRVPQRVRLLAARGRRASDALEATLGRAPTA
eukprot:CAMPEP_0119270936 /NCGR_PEP_ID=MMETSP1329-20130426/7741_1 /TAXON_ID=114041 /ORGANISM="Genus nov. species nov., Strain RCC1024" /LENGTH=207 /DNA_ID=CAMNT_0007270973 /DNA_START=97 /DNA_END=716 /DNA_ORIENTATION=-